MEIYRIGFESWLPWVSYLIFLHLSSNNYVPGMWVGAETWGEGMTPVFKEFKGLYSWLQHLWICCLVDKMEVKELKTLQIILKGPIDVQYELDYVLSFILCNHRTTRKHQIKIKPLLCLGTALPLEIYLFWCIIHSNILCSGTRHICPASRIRGPVPLPCAIVLGFHFI